MRLLLCILAGLLGLTGCNSTKGMKVDNPVVGPPPPRIESTLGAPGSPGKADVKIADAAADAAPIDGVLPVGGNVDGGTTRIFADGEVVATVNGLPIFAGEMLESYRANLARAKKEVTPEQYIKIREALVRRHLDAAIEKKLLVYGLTSKLKEPQIKALDAHLNEVFQEELTKMMKDMSVTSVPELEAEFAKRDLNLDLLKHAFRDQRMSQEFIAIKGQTKKEPNRQEMLDYYREHADEYALPAKVRWQQIRIGTRGRAKGEGERLVTQAAGELLQGASFADVARKYSDGPTAANGGLWEWTQKGSLADAEVEDVLFTLPVGEVSPLIRAKDSLQVVSVLERVDVGRVLFEDVQNDIHKAIMEAARRKQIEEEVEKLKAEAVIVTIFDNQPEADATVLE